MDHSRLLKLLPLSNSRELSFLFNKLLLVPKLVLSLLKKRPPMLT
jgi:hypothetical protein